MSKALLIIDWEKEWINPNSEYYIGSNLATETESINKVIQYARANDYKVLFVKHVESEGDAFKDNDSSTDFIDRLEVKETDVVIKKNKISSFYQTSLEDELKGIEGLIVAGILTNLCVRSAVQDAYDRDFAITMVRDCCVAFDSETQEFTLKDLKETRPEIELVTLDKLLNENT